MDEYMERGGQINLNHTNWTVGKLEEYTERFNEQAKANGLYCTGRIFQGVPICDDVWGAIQKSETDPEGDDILDKVSIAGQFEIGEDGVATWGMPMEISVTGPAVESEAINPAATIEAVSRAKSRAIMRKGDSVKKAGTEIDEKVNEKKAGTAIDEKLQQKADSDADSDAMKLKNDADSDAFQKPDAESGAELGSEEQKKSDAESDAEAEAKKSDSDALKMKDEDTSAAISNLNERLSRIEEMLDKLLEEEEGEHTTDTAITRAEQAPGAGASSPPDVPEAVAKMSKELAELKAQFSKIASAGVKKTLQSGTNSMSKDNEPEVLEVKEILGSI